MFSRLKQAWAFYQVRRFFFCEACFAYGIPETMDDFTCGRCGSKTLHVELNCFGHNRIAGEQNDRP